jgi:hypothetical protein
LDEAATAEARNNNAAMDASGTEVMEEWDTEDDTQDLPQLAGLEMSEGDGTVQQEGVEGSKDAEGGERAGGDAVEGEHAGEEHLAG